MSKQRLIDANALKVKMYEEAFETDTDEQRWDSGSWIRYRMFERNVDDAPAIDAIPVEWLEAMAENAKNPVMQAAIDFLLTVWRSVNHGAEMDGEQTTFPP